MAHFLFHVQAGEGISSNLVVQDNSAARLASSGAMTSSPAIRRWSRTASPFHFGSQLLCEIINYNSQQQHPLCASRLTPPPQTPSSPISIITTLPLCSRPPLLFLSTQLTYPIITSSQRSSTDDDDSSCCDAMRTVEGVRIPKRFPLELRFQSSERRWNVS